MVIKRLLVQCMISYNEYQKRYKDVMFEGAQGIPSYIGEIIDDLHGKGVSYDRMNGLADYLADKVVDSPLLWNVSVVNVYADTSDVLTRSSEYNVSLRIGSDGDLNTHINVEISKEYIDEKMLGMLLVFAVTFAVALIMIFELLKLPDSMFTRLSRNFRESRSVQAGAVAPVLRLGSFIAYTGMYVGIPFSSVLITQWNKSVFGLPVTLLASIPMTSELLATMLCSLLLLPVYRRMNLKLVFSVSTLISAAANFLCFFATSPEQLIILRFCSGIGFAGIKYSLNTIVSLGDIVEPVGSVMSAHSARKRGNWQQTALDSMDVASTGMGYLTKATKNLDLPVLSTLSDVVDMGTAVGGLGIHAYQKHKLNGVGADAQTEGVDEADRKYMKIAHKGYGTQLNEDLRNDVGNVVSNGVSALGSGLSVATGGVSSTVAKYVNKGISMGVDKLNSSAREKADREIGYEDIFGSVDAAKAFKHKHAIDSATMEILMKRNTGSRTMGDLANRSRYEAARVNHRYLGKSGDNGAKKMMAAFGEKNFEQTPLSMIDDKMGQTQTLEEMNKRRRAAY